MPTAKNTNIIANLRGKHDPHYKLAARVDVLEKEIRGISSIHGTLSKSFGMQRKTLMRVLALEKKVADLKSEVEAEENVGDWADEAGEWDTSGEASSASGATDGRYSSVGGETTDTRATGTATATKDAGYASRVMGQDASGEYLSPRQRKLAFKRKKISASAFRKGSSVGGAQKVAADTTGASALAVRPDKTQNPSIDFDSSAEEGGEKDTGGLLAPLQAINGSLNNINQTLVDGAKGDKKAADDARKAAEKKKRKGAENKLEKLGGVALKSVQSFIKPAMGIFERIWDFLKKVFLGRIVMKLFDWFQKNADKIPVIFRFLKDWWPVIVAGLMAFMPGLFLIPGIIALLWWGIPKIVAVGKFIGDGIKNVWKFITGGNKEGEKAEADVSKEIDSEEKTIGEGAKLDTGKFLAKTTPREEGPTAEVKRGGEDAERSVEQIQGQQEPAGGLGGDPGPAPEQMNKGGVVPGSGDRDTVPAMLTPGEFVMSKGAVKAYGSDTLAGMNAAAGGTNKPTGARYSGGGVVNHNKFIGQQIINPQSPIVRGYSGGGEVQEEKKGGFFSGIGGVMGKMVENHPMVKMIMKPLMEGVRKVISNMHVSLHNFEEQEGTTINPTIQHIEVHHPELAKKQKGGAEIGPPGGRDSTTVAYDKEIAAQNRVAAGEAPRQDLPQFDAGAMISIAKVKTLGITV